MSDARTISLATVVHDDTSASLRECSYIAEVQQNRSMCMSKTVEWLLVSFRAHLCTGSCGPVWIVLSYFVQLVDRGRK